MPTTDTGHRWMTRWPSAALLVLSLALPIPGSSPVVAEPETDAPPELEVLARYRVPDMEDRILDVQWAGRDSIYLGLFETGVVEVDLEEGLPVVDHVFGMRRDLPHLRMRSLRQFDLSEDWIVCHCNVGPFGRFAWARRGSGGGLPVPTVQRGSAGAFDFALDGDRLVFWGWPNEEHHQQAEGGVLWRARVSKGLDSWEVLYEYDELAAEPDLTIENLAARGSVEFHDGDVILAPNAPRVLPTVMRFSYQGKLKETWTAEELWNDEEGEVLDDAEAHVWTRERVGGKDYAKFLSTRRVVDAVLSLPEGPAVVVREPAGGEARWRLAVLSPEVRWYDIPVDHVSSVAQLGADADDDGRIVVVGTTREVFEEVRVTRNEVLVLRVPAD